VGCAYGRRKRRGSSPSTRTTDQTRDCATRAGRRHEARRGTHRIWTPLQSFSAKNAGHHRLTRRNTGPGRVLVRTELDGQSPSCASAIATSCPVNDEIYEKFSTRASTSESAAHGGWPIADQETVVSTMTSASPVEADRHDEVAPPDCDDSDTQGPRLLTVGSNPTRSGRRRRSRLKRWATYYHGRARLRPATRHPVRRAPESGRQVQDPRRAHTSDGDL